LQIEQAIKNVLAEAAPSIRFLGEEGGGDVDASGAPLGAGSD
jgi:fructose-1,6-bisphosphatase/inositol monophosphatase family enzyme